MYEYGDIVEPNYGDPYSDLAVGGVQQNPSVTTEQVPASDLAVKPNAPADDASAIFAQISPAYMAKLKMDPAEIRALDVASLKNLAYGSREDAWNAEQLKAPQNVKTTYALSHPEDYYQTYGTIPTLSLGESRYGYTPEGALDTAKGAEGFKQLTPDATASYSLYSPRTGKTLASGVGAEGLLSLAQQAQNLTVDKDRKADWQLIQTPAEGGDPQIVASNLFNSDLTLLGKIVAVGLPIATAFIPGLNLLGTIAASAAAGGVSAGMQDQDILKGALISGLTAGALKGTGLDKVIAGGISKVPVVGSAINSAGNAISHALGSVIPGAAVQGGLDAAGNILVNAATRAGTTAAVNAGVNSAVNAAVNAGTNTTYNAAQSNSPQPQSDLAAKPPVDTDSILVSAKRLQGAADAIRAGATSGQLAAQGLTTEQIDAARQLADQQATEAKNPIVVEATNSAWEPPVSSLAVPNVSTPPQTAPETVGENPITVEATNSAWEPPVAPFVVPNVTTPPQTAPDTGGIEVVAKKLPPEQVTDYQIPVPPSPSSLPPAMGETVPTTDNTSTKSTASKILDAAKGAVLLSGIIGGGSGSSGSGGNYLGTGNLSPTFTASLPGANLPGTTAGTTGTRSPSDLAVQGLTSNPQDWYRYGYGPQQSFFNAVPQGAPNTSKAYTGYADGGDVQGPGTGRSDSIPARLSDGEYVMDAETVALLGDGSTKAGAKKLDTFRVNLRKHKGRNLARGEFSVKAKAPERYLAGGRT